MNEINLPGAEVTEKELLSRVYSDSPELRSLIQVVPYIGGILDVYFTQPYSSWREKRIETYILYLHEIALKHAEELKGLAERSPEETIDAIMFSIDASIRTRSHTKKKNFAEILKFQALESKQWDEFDMALSLADELSDLHIEILKIMVAADEVSMFGHTFRVVAVHSSPPARAVKIQCPILSDIFEKVQKPVLHKAIMDLVSKGLIEDVGSNGWDAVIFYHFAPTDTAFWFTNWIKNS